MRVVHMIHSLEPGGAESVLVELAREAPAAGVEVAVMPLVRIRTPWIADRLRERGVTLLPLELPTRWDPRAFARAVVAVRRWGADVVHTHLKHADLVGAVVARRLHLPMVSTLHVVDDARGLLERGKRHLAALGRLTTATRTISVSDAQRAWYLRAFPRVDPDDVVTIPNGVADPADDPAADRAETRRALGLAPSTVAVLQVGLLRAGKGHDTLVEATRRLGDLPQVIVLVAGDGELRAQIEASASDLAGRMRFLGYRTDVPALLAAADIVVQPSEFDALPTTVIQALAGGRPVVASAVGGIPEIVTSDEGVLVPPRDPAALADAVRHLVDSPHRRAELGAAGRARFDARFRAAAWTARLAELYREVAALEVAR